MEEPKNSKEHAGTDLTAVLVHVFLMFAIFGGYCYAHSVLNLRGWQEFGAGIFIGVAGGFLFILLLSILGRVASLFLKPKK